MAINYLAVLVAAIASMLVGMAWYSKSLFGKTWMALTKMTDQDMQKAKSKGMSKLYIAAFIAALVMSYVLAMFVDLFGAATFSQALQVGFWIWLGFIATVMLNSVLWGGQPVKLYMINIGNLLVSLLVMSVILTLWV